MNDPSNEAKSIFLEAIDKHSPDQWPSFLEQACAGDGALRAEVEKLLRARSEMGSFHEPPRPALATVDEPVCERVGTLIGPYKLIQEIGAGGMGAVWMAQQAEPVKRLVALKVIKPGMDSRQVIVRFEAERQALALMDHPNIARVFDAGTTDAGRPYFVMELVKGVPLTKYCDEHRLTPRQRLELFVPVCHAIQHAHQKGIIHRDIKPSNVLVALYDGKPVPKVIDFGVAKATGQQLTEHTLVTGFGAVVGTLEYMSPEQAEVNQLDIDTRSDIYSLGVLLYELLTGSTPLERKRLKEAAMLEVLRLIREEEPPRPSTRLSDSKESLPSVSAQRQMEPAKLTSLVRGELDWIVMKALEKDRNRRYETANGFAMDVQRYLADEPVQACPPSVPYRLRKFARRNKGPMLTATVVAAALLVGTGVSIWQAIRATNALENERITRAALDQERTQINGKIGDTMLELAALREKALAAGRTDGKQWADLQDMVQRAKTLAGSELADPALVDRMQGLLQQVRQDAKNRRLTARLEEIRFDSLAARPGPAAPMAIGSAFADAFREYDLPVSDLPIADAARRIRDSGVRDDLLASLDAWAVWDARTGGKAWKGLLTIAQGADDHRWRRECRDAVLSGDRSSMVGLADRAESPRQPVEAVLLLAGILAMPAPGRSATDEEHLSAGGLLEKAAVWHPGNARFGIALTAWSPGKFRRTDTVVLASECIERLKQESASSELLAEAYFNLGSLLQAKGWLNNEKRDSAAVVAACRQAARLAPNRVQYWNLLISAIENEDEKIAECSAWILSGPPSPTPYLVRGVAYQSRNQWSAALPDYIKLTLLRPDDASVWKLLAQAHAALKQSDQALAAWTKAIEAAQRAGQNSSFYFHCRAIIYQDLRHWDKAIADQTQAIEFDLKERAKSKSPTEYSSVFWTFRGDSYRGKGDMQKALADYEMAIKSPSPLNSNPTMGLQRRAELYHQFGHWKEAIADYTELINVGSPQSAWYFRGHLAWQLVTCPDRSLRDPRRALELAKESARLRPDYRFCVGVAHYQLGQWKEAVEVLTKDWTEESKESSPGRRLNGGCYLAMAHWRLGHRDEARKWYERTLELHKKYIRAFPLLYARDEAESLIMGSKD
ncbi:MAG TPA: protein kinase [Gemmataceae bacterium]|nr:protein kinase [Gemmataceae bacterium]